MTLTSSEILESRQISRINGALSGRTEWIVKQDDGTHLLPEAAIGAPGLPTAGTAFPGFGLLVRTGYETINLESQYTIMKMRFTYGAAPVNPIDIEVPHVPRLWAWIIWLAGHMPL